MSRCTQIILFLLLQYQQMGSSDSKPEQDVEKKPVQDDTKNKTVVKEPDNRQNLAKSIINQNKNQKVFSNQKNNNSPSKIQSRGPSALDNYKKKKPSQDQPPSLNKIGTIQRQSIDQFQDHNQFMPLMKLDQSGQIKLKISLIELRLQQKPKTFLKKANTTYSAVLNWKKDNRNVFTFNLKEDQGYQLKVEVDIQGNTLNNKDQLWTVLCPINIPFGQTVKVGQFTCVNWYCRLQMDDDQIQNASEQGPSLKNIDFKITEETFGKWGQKVPKNFYDPSKKEVIKNLGKPNKKEQFTAYKQLSRYFDSKNIWKASTLIEQTSNHFRGWIVEVVSDQLTTKNMIKQLHNDVTNRERYYKTVMFEKNNI